MKIYYTSPVKFNTENQNTYSIIEDAMKERGHKMLMSKYSNFKSFEDYQKLDDNQIYELYRESEKSLKDADIVIANVTHQSNRVSYEIATALLDRKPVIAIFREDSGTKLLPPIEGNESKYLTVARFKDNNDLGKSLLSAFEETRKKIDTKFILIISPEIDKYLEWAAQERRQHKAQVVREAIESVMNKDREYQQKIKDAD